MRSVGFGPGGICPDALLPHLEFANNYNSDIREIFFSGPTYQICCSTSGEPAWVFLQLDTNHHVKDIFCNCAECSEQGACLHMATAVRAVFGKQTEPLHRRFLRSPIAEAITPLVLSQNPISFSLSNRFLEIVVGLHTIECQGEPSFIQELLSLLQSNTEETEETSIKFSESSPEEILLWRRGECSDRLRLELSPLYDIAKMLFWKGEMNGLSYKYQDDRLLVAFRKNTCSIPVLEKNSLDIVKELSGPTDIVEISYEIQVHAGRGLTITPFVDEVGDLQGGKAWTQKRGPFAFDPLKGGLEELQISLDELSDFLLSHQHWLSMVPGCTIHEHPLLEKVSYEVDEDGVVTLHRQSGKPKQKILGDWTYVDKEGFFPVTHSDFELYERPLPPFKVGEFIRQHKDWLEQIPGFFAEEDPISGVHIEIGYTGSLVNVQPLYLWKKAIYQKKAVVYDGFGYIPRVGFFPLPSLDVTKTYSEDDPEIFDRFFVEELPLLQTTYDCHIDHHLLPPEDLKLVCDGLEPEELMEGRRVPSWWKASFYWEAKGRKVTPDQLLRAYRRGRRFVPTSVGLFDLSDQRFGWLSSIFQRSQKGRRLKTTDFVKIQAHDDLSFGPEVSSTSSVIERLLRQESETEPDIQSFQSSLRPYQRCGVDWLWYLYSSRLSGLLCDDMGVGKTHQAMALMCAINAEGLANGTRNRFLILCPASLVWHWQEKIKVTLPHVSCLTYVGPDRATFDLEGPYDVLLTTYGIWRAEVKKLHKIIFELAIFDELQIAKNHVSQIWAALSKVKATMRLGLTGTPVENQLRELRAVFDLVLPGYLPEATSLGEVNNIFSEYDGRDLLSRYVRPFLLRRRKQDVLPDLPAKVEELYPTELVGSQEELYHLVASRQSAPLISQLQDDSSKIPYMHIFALLSALKQICDHPAVYNKDIENYTQYDSGKWEAFVELLEEAEESGQKVVVFSQFLSMLDIMKRHLKSRNIGFSEIRGSTRARGDEISRFQNDPDCKVFLGSLQASGLGIDLTAGSIVIHYDRWWNAARENQATDRVHRIGQSRGVMVYKLMTVKTIEERIDQIIARKVRLFEDVVSYDDHQMIKKLDRGELLDLLQGL